MTMRSPQRKRGAGAARHLACALLISVHAAAAHERPAAAIANALVVANEQRASIDVPSATKSDAGSSSAVLQSAALLHDVIHLGGDQYGLQKGQQQCKGNE